MFSSQILQPHQQNSIFVLNFSHQEPYRLIKYNTNFSLINAKWKTTKFFMNTSYALLVSDKKNARRNKRSKI